MWLEQALAALRQVPESRETLEQSIDLRLSLRTSLYPLSLIMRESYNRPEAVYRLAKARGMDLVAITDHDCIAGALSLADRPDVVVGCEVTACFPADGVRVHLTVLDLTERQFLEIDRRRGDVSVLMPYLRQQGIFTSLNHVASRVNGAVTATHVAALVPWLDALEVRNGSRLVVQNRTAAALADATGLISVGGSDAHTMRGIGQTWVEVGTMSSLTRESVVMVRPGVLCSWRIFLALSVTATEPVSLSSRFICSLLADFAWSKACLAVSSESSLVIRTLTSSFGSVLAFASSHGST